MTDGGSKVNVVGRRKPELLAPAGSWESLRAAVSNGADAVYLGVREFNARKNARNFSIEELGQVTGFCHEKGVRVYLTLNILVKNHELSRFFNVLDEAYSLGVDGVIIQHLSLLDIIKDNYPGLKVFMSTQAAVGNVASASLLKRADRIILPRELPLEAVRAITAAGVETEVFVHGALCFSYSGMCLFSSFVANRSGNRGSCAQLCRKKYNGSYLLSTRELCTVRRIPELIEAGVTGFKIEGRMRTPLYVAVATRLYRKAIDSCLSGRFEAPAREMAEMEVVFNREFTEGFMFGSEDVLSPEKPMNRGAFLGSVENGLVEVTRAVAVGDGVGIWGAKGVSGAVIREMAVDGKPVESVEAGARVRLGIDVRERDRVYLTSSTRIRIEPEFTVDRAPLAASPRQRATPALPEAAPRRAPSVTKLMAKVYSLPEAREASRAGSNMVFYDVLSPDFPASREWSEKALLGAYLPRILGDAELERCVDALRRARPAAILCGNLGFLAYRREFDIPVYLDYSVNCFNDLDVAFFRKLDSTPTLSPELSLRELHDFRRKNVAILCHADIVLVNTRIEIAAAKLSDEMGFDFPVRKEGGYRQVLNSRRFGMFNDAATLHQAGYSEFLIDMAGQAARWTAVYRGILRGEGSDRRARKGYTSGHLYRPVD